MKNKVYGYQASNLSQPVPASVAKKYHKYIADVDNAGTDEGKLFYSCRGIAFRDAGYEVAQHCYAGTVTQFRQALIDSEECHCETCQKEFWNDR